MLSCPSNIAYRGTHIMKTRKTELDSRGTEDQALSEDEWMKLQHHGLTRVRRNRRSAPQDGIQKTRCRLEPADACQVPAGASRADRIP